MALPREHREGAPLPTNPRHEDYAVATAATAWLRLTRNPKAKGAEGTETN